MCAPTAFGLRGSGNVPFVPHSPHLKNHREHYFNFSQPHWGWLLFAMRKHFCSHIITMWFSDVECLIICGSQLDLAWTNMEQHLRIKERLVTFGWVCFSIFLWLETVLHREILVWFIFSECSQGFRLPITLHWPVVAGTLETLSLVIFQLDKVFTSLISEHVSTEFHSPHRIN